MSRVQNEEDSLLVRWVAPLRQNGKIRFYLVYYSLSSLLFSLDAASRHNTSSPDTSTVIEGLYAFTSYQVVVHCGSGVCLLSCTVAYCVVFRYGHLQLRTEILVNL